MGKLRRGMEFFIPSYWEIQVTFCAAVFIMFLYYLYTNFLCSNNGTERELEEEENNEEIQKEDFEDSEKIKQIRGESNSNSAFVIQVELLAAKNLVAANINGTSDPYAIITCGEEKRFSSMVPGSRNPIWGEEFNFLVDSIPTEVHVEIYDWDIVWKSNVLGSLTVPVRTEMQESAVWYELDSTGEVCLQIKPLKLAETSARVLNNFPGANARRRISNLDRPGLTVVHQKPGPMQTIFGLPPDEVVEHSYSCALERSFLYHGRMYVSAWHICFHSNVFSKQIKVVIPFGDIDEIRKSQHALINPAITIVLRTGAGGYGVPPLSSPDGRVNYMFASFWNRSHTMRILQKSAENYLAMLLAEKKEWEQSAKRAHSSSVRRPINETVIPENNADVTAKIQPFIKEEVLVSIFEDVFPCTAEQFFFSLLNDDSKYIAEYRSKRQDLDLNMGQWHVAEEYDGQVREITYRSICRSPMCPPYTAVTEWQHFVLSSDKSKLVFETVQQVHDVPFGSYFEIHCRWSLETNSPSSCTLNIKVGAHFKKWCPMQSKIKTGAVEEYKKEVDQMLEIARAYLQNNSSSNNDNNDIVQV
ncbi:hypothetical protein LUZ60_015891 [Juncus effusus]|nr:hypothetical protein LUZ60_015891 [Juncus effusus]